MLLANSITIYVGDSIKILTSLCEIVQDLTRANNSMRATVHDEPKALQNHWTLDSSAVGDELSSAAQESVGLLSRENWGPTITRTFAVICHNINTTNRQLQELIDNRQRFNDIYPTLEDGGHVGVWDEYFPDEGDK
jgi:hypothetical protein